jgi:hypothetical protein
LGFIDRPSADTTVAASTSRLGRRPDFGSGLPRPERCSALAVPPGFSGFSAASESEDPLVRLSAGLLHPAAGHGVHHVSDFLLGLSTERRPEGRGPRGPSRSRPLWRRPFEAFPSSAAGPCRHRVSSFRTRSRSPTGVPSRRSEPRPLPCRHGALRCSPTSGLSSAEESVAMRATLPLRARSMLPWALDRLVPDAAARFALPSVAAGRFAWRPEPLRRPPTRTSGEGRVFRPCLAPATRCHNRPRREIAAGRRGSGNSRRSRLGRTPSCLTECQWIRPERKVHRVGPVTRRCWVADVIATHLRRDSFATQCSLRRAATGGSSSCSPSFRGCPRT